MRGCGGGEVCARGVEAGRAGTNAGAGAAKVDVGAGIVVLEEVGWVDEAKEKGWGAVCPCAGNGFKFVEGNGFGLAAFGSELFDSAVNGFAFVTTGNGFIVCPVLGNGFVPELVGNGFVPSEPFWDVKGLKLVGAG